MSIPITAKDEPDASIRSAFSWTFPGAPIRIKIPLDLISRLQTELDQHETPANSLSGAEVGGVLLGHQTASTTLQIDDYIWVSSEERPGNRYLLDSSELGNLREVYTTPVGYFRTQSEDNLHLRDEEIHFVREHFPHPTNVVLLIRTSRRPYIAGFFFWMKEHIFAPLSFMDFPLDAKLLQLHNSRSKRAAVTQPTEEEETIPRLPAKTDDRTASRALESASILGEESISAPADDLSISLWLRSHLERLWGHRSISIAIAAMLAVLGLVGSSALLFRDRGLSGPKPNSAATTPAFPLQLDVEAKGNGLDLRWNPQSVLVTRAHEGHLVIREGDKRPRIVPLDPLQLTSGHVYYRSSAERLLFQLEIVDNSGKVTRESVLALSSKPSPAVTPVAPPSRENGSDRPVKNSASQ